MSIVYSIYALSSSSNPEIYKYIGYTKKTLNKRLIEHVSESKTLRTKKDKWVRCEIKNGNTIQIDLLDEFLDILEVKSREIEYIKLFKSLGATLKNGTVGGDGAVNHICPQSLKDWNTETKSKRVFMFDYKTGGLINEFIGVSKMCSICKFNSSGVWYVLNGKKLTHKGYWFSYTNEFNPREKRPRAWNKGLSTKYMQGFKTKMAEVTNGYISLIFDNLNEAAASIGIHRKTFSEYAKVGVYKDFKIKILT